MQRLGSQCAQPAQDAWRMRGPIWRRMLFILFGVLLVLGGMAGAQVAVRAETVHVIRAGESLAGIARQYQVDPGLLAEYNSISNPNLIVSGQQLAIPPRESSAGNAVAAAGTALPGEGGYHVVAAGESLSQVARRYDLALGDLLRLNNLPDANVIWIGQKLRLTARVTPVAAQQSTEPSIADDIYVVEEGDTPALIAKVHNTSVEQLMRANGLPNSGFVYPGQRLRIVRKPAPSLDNIFGVAGAPADGRRWIAIDLSDQTLTAWQGDVPVLHTTVSTGKAATPTVVGSFAIGTKYDSQDMSGDDYFLEGVPWVMYFFEDYAIHGAYWHANFGTPTSHGCVNMRIDEAKTLYQWAGPGTEVVVQE